MVLKCLVGLLSIDIVALVVFCAIISTEGAGNVVSARTAPSLDENDLAEGALKEA